MCYREYVDEMFKYFEKLGVISVFIKELMKEENVNKEFYENILAYIIIFFEKGKDEKLNLKLIKEYPLPKTKQKKGLFGFLRKK